MNLWFSIPFSGEQVPKESKEDGAVKSTSVASRRAAEGSVEKRAAEFPAQTSAGGGCSDEGIICFSYCWRFLIDRVKIV